jgi:hypothetical protein
MAVMLIGKGTPALGFEYSSESVGMVAELERTRLLLSRRQTEASSTVLPAVPRKPPAKPAAPARQSTMPESSEYFSESETRPSTTLIAWRLITAVLDSQYSSDEEAARAVQPALMEQSQAAVADLKPEDRIGMGESGGDALDRVCVRQFVSGGSLASQLSGGS